MNAPSMLTSSSHERARHVVGVVAALALLVVCTSVWADDMGALPNSSVSRGPLQLDVRQPATRAALTPAERYSPGPWNDPAAMRLRYVGWTPVGSGSAVGLSVGASTSPSVAAAATAQPYDPRYTNPALSPEVGVRWRSQIGSNRHIDVDAWSAYDNSPDTPAQDRRTYNARVELQFKDAPSKLGLDLPHGAMGMQMSRNSTMGVKANHGGPMLYYRSHW